MHLTPLAYALIFAVLLVAYVCSCLLNLVDWCLEALTDPG